ncbi:MAG TPA: D-aminoacylase [Gemmatimonadaceae bacterium]|nr:D-aminoacylase [Gemmatimonadaceae bacterium]
MRRATILASLLLAACATAGRPALEPPYDLLIVHGRIVDGTGNPWYYGDLAIRGDRIARVGPGLEHLSAKRVIDARGMVVAPGFIDMLGHSEYTLLSQPQALSKITQGITSEITGEVYSVWPNTTPTTGASAPRAPRWTSLPGYFDQLQRHGTAINLGTFIAAGSVRRAVMGDASRRPTPEELAKMGDLVEEGMRGGAMGFSTGLIYPPSTWFTTEELTALAKRAAPYGGGYASHIRSEGPQLLEAIREAIAIGTGAGTWIEIRHLKASGQPNWDKMRDAIALIDSARRAGVDVTADQYPYTASGTGLSAILPTWVQAGGTDSMIARLQDSTVRARLRADRLRSPVDARAPDQVLINEVTTDSLRIYEGKMLDEVGRMRHEDPYDAAYDILIADHGETSAIYFTMSEDDVRMAMRQPWVAVGQDAGAVTPDSSGHGRGHPRGFGTFPRILGRYVRQDSVLRLEQAVRKMTSLAAQRVGLDERGVLKRGMYADVVVFDPATVIDRATYQEPELFSTGVRWVAVNGVLVLDEGRPTGALPGRALLGPGARR